MIKKIVFIFSMTVVNVIYGSGYSNYHGAYTATANGYTWMYQNCDGGVRIVGDCVTADDCPDDYYSTFCEGSKPSGAITIPTYLDGKLVVEIGPWAFCEEYECGAITSITIPASIRTIDDSAFDCWDMPKLASYSVASENVNYSSYDGVLYDKKQTTIKNFPLAKTSVSLPSTVSNVYNMRYVRQWSDACKMSSISVSSQNPNFASVGGVLYNKAMTQIVCCPPYLTSATLPDGLTRIEESAFSGCSQLTSVTLSSRLKTIGRWAFADCGKLTAISFPNGLTEIAAGAFKNCSSLTSLEIPTSVRTIGGSVYCYYRSATTSWYSSWNGAFEGCTGLKSLTVSEGLKKIGGCAFLGCTSLTTVSLPASLSSIGDCAFAGCDKLQSVTASLFPQSAYWGMYFYEKDLEDSDYDGWCLCSDPEYEPDPEYYEITEKHVTPTITPIPIKQLTIPDGTSEIEANAYSGCTTIESLTIPDSVKKIGASAFNGCTSLNRVDIGDLTNWYGVAFGDCAANPLWCGHHLFSNGEEITALELPSSMEIIGANVFAGASFIESVKIPATVTNIGVSAFAGCTGLTRVDISDLSKWYKIAFGNETANPLCCGHRLFVNGEELTSLAVPNDVAEILPYTFNGASFTSVTIPHGVNRIGAGAFGGCSSLNRVNISDLAKWCAVAIGNESANPLYRGRHLFLNDSEITSLVIPSGVQSIGNYAFINATALTSVKIPASVESVGTDAFKGCTGLTQVTIEDLSKWCGVAFANGDANPLSVAQHLYLNSDEITELVIPSGVSSIGQYAFQNASHITSVKIPAEVTTIGSGAFSGCSGVRSADVPAQFNLGNLFPAAKTSMERLTIPNGTTDIAANAYAGFGNIKEVVFPVSVTNVGSKAFAECKLLGRVDITDLTKWCAIHFADSEANPLVHNGSLFMDGVAVEHLVIPDEVTSISDYAFNNATGIVSATISSNIVAIGGNAFAGCTGLARINVEDLGKWCSIQFANNFANPLTCGRHLFVGGNEIVVLDVPDTVSAVCNYAFYNASSITSVRIPASVTNIATEAFSGCAAIRTIEIPASHVVADVFPDAYAEITEMTIPVGTTVIAENAYAGCAAISAVTIPASVTSIGANAFTGCTGIRTIDIPASYNVATVFPSAYSAITQLTIPEGTTTIAAKAYQGCSSVAEVVVPASVTTVGSGAFQDCSNLKSVTFKGQAPACGDNVFTGTSADMVVYAGTGTSGWTQWNGRPLAFVDPGSGSGSGSETVEKAQLTVTNVVIHYIVNSVVPEKTYPATYDTGFVNIITEVKSGGAVSVPATWMVNYPNYVTKFGADFTKSLMKPTGKYDGAGNPMCVWQDYVAGTDPTDPDDKFTASITMDKDGKITVSYSPEFTDANEKSLRVYTTYGKKSLTEKDWVVVPTGSEADYNFFKVTVEMK